MRSLSHLVKSKSFNICFGFPSPIKKYYWKPFDCGELQALFRSIRFVGSQHAGPLLYGNNRLSKLLSQGFKIW
jgi:hypothetical protein